MPLYIGYDEERRAEELRKRAAVASRRATATGPTPSSDTVEEHRQRSDQERDINEPSGAWLWVIVGICLIAVCVAYLTALVQESCTVNFVNILTLEDNPGATAFPGATPVREIHNNGFPGWGSTFRGKHPVAIRDFAATREWSCRRWTPQHLASALQRVTVHTSTEATVQMFSKVQPFGQLDGQLQWTRSWVEETMNASTFFGTNEGSATAWPYLYMNLEDLPLSLLADIGDLLSLGSRSHSITEAALWAGPPGISSPLHYDAAHNIYHQLLGVKRFILFPPSKHMRLYPRLHPSTRQSQINLRSVPSESGKCPAGGQGSVVAGNFWEQLQNNSLEAVEIVLHPGDVLYIPPYWWHRASVPAEAEETSVSVAVYSTSSAMEVYEIFKNHKLPFDPSWQYDRKVAALREYVLSLASLSLESNMCGDGSQLCGAPLLLHLLEDRYAPVAYDPSVQGWNSMIEQARAQFRGQKHEVLVPDGVRDAMASHAALLRKRVLDSRGELTQDQFQSEVLSLIEDVTAFMLTPNMTEAFLFWAAGGVGLDS